MTVVGAVHLIFSLVAVLAGAVVLMLDKGTRWHRSWGHAYTWAMVGVVVTSFGMYNMTGRWGPFHVFAAVAGVTLLAGIGMVLLRRPRGGWLEGHATTMSWSYIGLMAAFAAESLSRFVMPYAVSRFDGQGQLLGIFWSAVGVATFATVAAGWWLVKTRLPGSLAATPRAMREERAELRQLEEAAKE